MGRARLQAGQVQRAQPCAGRGNMRRDLETPADLALQINAAPPHDAVPVQVRPVERTLLEFGHLRIAQVRRPTGNRLVRQPGNPAGDGKQQPVAQDLPVHAAGRRRLGAGLPVQNKGDGKQAPNTAAIAQTRGDLPQRAGAAFRAGDLDRLAHGAKPCKAEAAERIRFQRRWKSRCESMLSRVGIPPCLGLATRPAPMGENALTVRWESLVEYRIDGWQAYRIVSGC